MTIRLAFLLAPAVVLAPAPASAQGGSAPPPSAGHAMIYDDSLGAVLMVNTGLGSMSPPPPDTPTLVWRWTGARWEILDRSGPPIRNLGGVAYDVHRNAVVLYGGTYDAARSYGDTWEWRPDRG